MLKEKLRISTTFHLRFFWLQANLVTRCCLHLSCIYHDKLISNNLRQNFNTTLICYDRQGLNSSKTHIDSTCMPLDSSIMPDPQPLLLLRSNTTMRPTNVPYGESFSFTYDDSKLTMPSSAPCILKHLIPISCPLKRASLQTTTPLAFCRDLLS